MKRVGRHTELFERLISQENLLQAINEVNSTHHWHSHHRPNRCTAWVEETKLERVEELRQIIVEGFEQKPPHVTRRWDVSARKWRTVSEPAQWPDQYIHHALIQVLQPKIMKGMDFYCCGSIRGRGPHHARKAIARWMEKDPKGTKYELCGDIRHFYDSLQPEVVMARMQELFKDRLVLNLIWRIIKDGVLIGAYTSQWFANATLQPLDRLIRESGMCKHYTRYMDNLTIFGPNKRKLKKLRLLVEGWLHDHGLELKGDWQIFPTVGNNPKEPLPEPRKGYKRPKARLPDAVGYRYGRGYTIPRKHNLLRTKRAIARYRKRRNAGKKVTAGSAASIISRLGQLAHCNNYHLYQQLFRGERIQRELKAIIRANNRKETLTWSMYLTQRARSKSSKPRAPSTPT